MARKHGPLTFRQIEAALLKHGFTEKKPATRGRHRQFKKPGHTYNVTVAGHGKTEVKDNILSSIRRQSNLPLSCLRGDCDCL